MLRPPALRGGTTLPGARVLTRACARRSGRPARGGALHGGPQLVHPRLRPDRRAAPAPDAPATPAHSTRPHTFPRTRCLARVSQQALQCMRLAGWRPCSARLRQLAVSACGALRRLGQDIHHDGRAGRCGPGEPPPLAHKILSTLCWAFCAAVTCCVRAAFGLHAALACMCKGQDSCGGVFCSVCVRCAQRGLAPRIFDALFDRIAQDETRLVRAPRLCAPDTPRALCRCLL